MKKFELYFRLFKIPLDLLLIVLAFITAYHYRLSEFVVQYLSPVELRSFYFERDNFVWEYALPLALFLLFIMFVNGIYSLKNRDGFWSELKMIVFSVMFWLGSIITYFFLVRDFPFSRFVLLGSAVFTLVYLFIGRFGLRFTEGVLVKRGYGVKKVVLVINDKKPLKKLVSAFKDDARYVVVGYIADKKLNTKNLKYFGDLSSLETILLENSFDDLVQVGDLEGKYKNQDIIDLCRFYHKEYLFVPEVFQVQRHNIVLSEVSGLPIFRVKPTPLDGWGRVLKRIFDIVASFLGMIILMPVFGLVALLVKIDSKGPVFFRHNDDGSFVYRIGQKGNPFVCFKFRTMHINTHKMRYSELAENDLRKGSPLVKIKDDPRVTKLGYFLRRFDIDELPQLWNVFIGEMSLIGPRPHLLEEVAKYEKHHKFVLTVKPGISGLAQVSGRSDLDFEEEVKLDTYYIENWSLWLDIKILLKTVLVVLKGHNEFS